MKVRNWFWIFSVILLVALSILSYFVFYKSSTSLFFIVEGFVLFTALYLFIFYGRIIKPLHIIGNGMELLREQDFSSRLRYVKQPDADRIVDIFNKMMEQLKDERLHLREQNHLLDLLIDASPMGVVMLDLDQRVYTINPAAHKMLGPSSAAVVVGQLLAQIDSPLASAMCEIPLYCSRTVRLDGANVYKCTHSSFIDRGFQHSFYLVEPLTQEVFNAEKKAYEKVIRMIAHEVNNTMAGISSTLDTLQSTFSGIENMDDVCEVLRVSSDRCYSMSRFITNFADVVRIPEPQLRVLQLNDVVTACKRFMETICLNRNIDIVMELNEKSPVVKLDNTLFEQVLVNIIKNAAEAIAHDGKIFIRTSCNPSCLEIADTGKAISKEIEAKIFSPFFSTKPDGQGLGLIFIREVLLKHNCTFSLRTYDDGLTRFRILFG
ncbi:MAG: ATP-binding protein [Parabacteroides sp.]|nr:ATP-binding protein [Parabacteroides sp.]